MGTLFGRKRFGKRSPDNAWVYDEQIYRADGSQLSYPQQLNNKNTFEIIVLESPSRNESPANRKSPAKPHEPISLPASDAVQLLSLLYDGKQSENGFQENNPQQNLYTTQSTIDLKNSQPHYVGQVNKSNPPQQENDVKEREQLPQNINNPPQFHNWEPAIPPSPPPPHHPPPRPPPPPHHRTPYPPPPSYHPPRRPPPPPHYWNPPPPPPRRRPPSPPPPPGCGWPPERRDPPPHATGPPRGRGPPPYARGRGPPPRARGPPHRYWETASYADRTRFDEPNMHKESPAQMEKSVNNIDPKDPVSDDSNAVYDKNQGRGVPLTVNKDTHDDIQQLMLQPQPHIFQVVPVTPDS